jgi:hypothetical protein
MAVRRCSLHLISYPSSFTRCMVDGCTETLDYCSNIDPDEDFEDKADYYNHILEDNEAIEFKPIIQGPKIIQAALTHLKELAIPDCQDSVREHRDMLWIPHESLIQAGYLNLEDFSVVMIGGKFYELQAHIGRSYMTVGLRGGVWWVEEVNPDVVAPDYPPEGGDSHGEEDAE